MDLRMAVIRTGSARSRYCRTLTVVRDGACRRFDVECLRAHDSVLVVATEPGVV